MEGRKTIEIKTKIPEPFKYYDGTKILSMKDANGNKPGIYIITSNRTAGKTTYFARLVVKRFIKKKEKFIILFRTVGQLHNLPQKFFNDIKGLFFLEYDMTDKCHDKDGYTELYLKKNGVQELCGYALALNSADKIKNCSHLFNDCTCIWFDEFQVASGYVSNEIDKFLSIYFSVTRGNGQQFRYVPVYFTGNHVDLFNPYYVELGICDKLKIDTKFMKGDGYVIEQNLNLKAIEARKESGVVKAFLHHQYIQTDLYMYDDLVIMDKPKGPSAYFCTLKYKGEFYGIELYQYCLFIKPNGDKTYRKKFACTIDDIEEDIPLMSGKYEPYRSYFCGKLKEGKFKFKNPTCKHVLFEILLPYIKRYNHRSLK